MKEMTFPTRMYLLVNDMLDALIPQKKHSTNIHSGKEQDSDQRRSLDRKDFSYYMPVFNHDTQELVGHLTDISPRGFKLDCENPIPLNEEFRFYMDLISEVASKPSMVFVARSRWCQVDRFDPFCYNVGFQLIDIAPEDVEIFNRIIEKYGTEHQNKRIDLRRTNMW
jgi:PilZ domain